MHAELSIVAWMGLIFIVAVVLAIVLARLRLPVVIGYLGTGIFLGPSGLALVERHGSIEVLAEIGVTLLLFTIGLEFSLGELRRSWRAVLVAGGGQVLLTIAAALAVALALDRSPGEGLAWGFMLALSSTAVVLRLLDTRGESRAPHGRLVIGVLIFQDLCIVPMMLLLPVLAGGGDTAGIALVMAKAAGVVLLTVLAGRWLAPPMLMAVARTRDREVFLLAVLAVASIVALATAQAGLSLALGAFLAGMVLADTHYAHQALADVLPLRTVMMCVFFVSIGMLVDLDLIFDRPLLVGGLIVAVLLGKSLLMGAVGLGLRFPVPVSALAAVALAQVGEFSLVLAGEAERVGLISAVDGQLFLAVAVGSIALAPLAVSFSPRILNDSGLLAPLQRLLYGTEVPTLGDPPQLETPHVIVAGLGVGGRAVVTALESVGVPVVLVDLNPATIAEQAGQGRHVVYGDLTSPAVLHHAGIETARALVIVVSDPRASHLAVEVAHGLRPDLPVLLRTRYATEEGAERGPMTEVVSEEFSGALAICRRILRQVGAPDIDAVIRMLVERHEALPPEAEDPLPAPKAPGPA